MGPRQAIRPGRSTTTARRRRYHGPRWKPVAAQTLVIWGQRDRVLGQGAGGARSRAGCRTPGGGIPGASHWVQADAPSASTSSSVPSPVMWIGKCAIVEARRQRAGCGHRGQLSCAASASWPPSTTVLSSPAVRRGVWPSTASCSSRSRSAATSRRSPSSSCSCSTAYLLAVSAPGALGAAADRLYRAATPVSRRIGRPNGAVSWGPGRARRGALGGPGQGPGARRREPLGSSCADDAGSMASSRYRGRAWPSSKRGKDGSADLLAYFVHQVEEVAGADPHRGVGTDRRRTRASGI